MEGKDTRVNKTTACHYISSLNIGQPPDTGNISLKGSTNASSSLDLYSCVLYWFYECDSDEVKA